MQDIPRSAQDESIDLLAQLPPAQLAQRRKALVDQRKTAGRPPGPGSTAVAAFLCDYFRARGTRQVAPHWLLRRTPLSLHAPCCDGALVALYDKRLPAQQMRAIMRARLGRPALWLAPFAPACRRASRSAGKTQPALHTLPYSLRHSRDACMRCGQMMEDTFHILTECTFEPVQAARQLAISELPAMLQTVVATCRAAGATMPPAAAAPAQQPAIAAAITIPAATSAAARAAAALTPALTQMDWSASQARHMLFQLLVAVPWSASSARDSGAAAAAAVPADPQQQHLSLLLGAMLDQTTARPFQLRAAARAWVPWAGKHCLASAVAWASGPSPAAAAAEGSGVGTPQPARRRARAEQRRAPPASTQSSSRSSSPASVAPVNLRRSSRLARRLQVPDYRELTSSRSSGSASDDSVSGGTTVDS